MKAFEAIGGLGALELELESALRKVFRPEEFSFESNVFSIDITNRFRADEFPETDQRIPNYFRDRLTSNLLFELTCTMYRTIPNRAKLFIYNERTQSLLINTSNAKPLTNMVVPLFKKYVGRPFTVDYYSSGEPIVYNFGEPRYNLDNYLAPDLAPVAKFKWLFANYFKNDMPPSGGMREVNELIDRFNRLQGSGAELDTFVENTTRTLKTSNSPQKSVVRQVVRCMAPLAKGKKRRPSGFKASATPPPATAKSFYDVVAFYTDHGTYALTQAVDSAFAWENWLVAAAPVHEAIKRKRLTQEEADAMLAYLRGERNHALDQTVL